MLRGRVNAKREPSVELKLITETGFEFSVDAAIDTGFTDTLVLPGEIILDCNLEPEMLRDAVLADGISRSYPVYSIKMNWFGTIINVFAYGLGNSALIGMSLLQGCELKIDCRLGGVVEIRPGVDW
jgi:clan AA aspartic protease